MFSADTAIIMWKVFFYLTQMEHEKCFQEGSERNIVGYTFYVPCRYSLDTCKIYSWYFFYIHIKNNQKIYMSKVLKQVSEAVFLWETQVSPSSESLISSRTTRRAYHNYAFNLRFKRLSHSRDGRRKCSIVFDIVILCVCKLLGCFSCRHTSFVSAFFSS